MSNTKLFKSIRHMHDLNANEEYYYLPTPLPIANLKIDSAKASGV